MSHVEAHRLNEGPVTPCLQTRGSQCQVHAHNYMHVDASKITHVLVSPIGSHFYTILDLALLKDSGYVDLTSLAPSLDILLVFKLGVGLGTRLN